MPEMTYAQAALAAVAEEMRRDPTIFYLTTDAIPALAEEFGPMRTRPTPIAESAMTGMAIGAAGSGMRPICDWRQVTFCFVAMDQIVNQAAKIHYMFGGQAKFPVTFRAAVGGGQRLVHHPGERDDRAIPALPLHVGDTERNRVVAFRHLAPHRRQPARLERDDRIVLADR